MTDDTQFRRLHPLSIVLKSVTAIGQNLIGIGVLYFSVFDRNIALTSLATITLIAFIIGVFALIWWRFTYHVGTKEIRIKSGLLRRNNRSIPFDRIQDISLERNLLNRLLGLATVKLETGASAGEDGKLDALSLTDARILRDMLRDYKSGITAGEGDMPGTGQSPQAEERPPLFAMDNRRIFIAGLFNFSFILLTILAAIAQQLDFLIPDQFLRPLYRIKEFDQDKIFNGISFALQIAGLVGALVSLLFMGVFSGVILTFIREYGFRLDRVDSGRPGFRRRRGLFTLTDMVMPFHRVQAAIIKTGPIRSHFGWHHLQFQSLAGDGKGESDHSAAPCARLEEIDPILAEAGIDNVTDELEFLPVHPAMWWRDALIWTAVLLAVGIANGLLSHPAAFGLVFLAIPISIVKYLNWRHHHYALSDTHLFVRRGWWRSKLTILPIRKVQTVDIGQSPLDHPLGLASVTVGVAGGSSMAPLKICAIPLTAAKALRSKLISPALKT
ncbi:PH domain-containing protein [Parasphingorhabdus sp.]|uniref:PH domain-containing protein n=1 Tax=Parasphingorhabdus sp. TaxID=2709688 RepID=UPI002F92BA26